jgi:hypothetical protein
VPVHGSGGGAILFIELCLLFSHHLLLVHQAKPRQIVYSLILFSLLFCVGSLSTQAARILDELSHNDVGHVAVLVAGVQNQMGELYFSSTLEFICF